LDVRNPKPRKTTVSKATLPSHYLFDAECITVACFVHRQKTALNGRDYFRLTMYDPPLCVRSWKGIGRNIPDFPLRYHATGQRKARQIVKRSRDI
jgi:hypothetical protein